MECRKQNVSVRMANSDLHRIKEISKRLGVKESDLFRFCVKSVLSKLMPLQDESIKGSDLMPVFIDIGDDLARFFELDAARLEKIINGDLLEIDKKVPRDDIDLLALASISERYVVVKLSEMSKRPVSGQTAFEALREYFKSKYGASDSIGEVVVAS